MFGLIVTGDLEGVQQAVQSNPAKLNARVGLERMTPLILAVYLGERSAIVQWLIDCGAKLNLQDDHGWTALMLACRFSPDNAQVLIRHGAKLDLQDKNGWTALLCACREDHPATAQALVQRGAKVNLQDDDGWTALMYASTRCQPDTVKALIQRGAEVDVRNNNGWTALMLACQEPARHHNANDLLRCIKHCYVAGADLSLRDSMWFDALSFAELFSRANVASFLKFAMYTEVPRILLNELRQPRSLVVAFYDEDLLSWGECSVIQDADLQNMGVTSSIKRRIILKRINQPVRRSLFRRASLQVAREVRRLSGSLQYDAFLTHDWGIDGENHQIVSQVNARIRNANKSTWFDEERVTGNIVQQITRGIESSRKVVVFVTERYMHKLQSEGNDYCKNEFLTAVRVHTAEKMIPVVLEISMLDTMSWRGPLQFELGGHIYIDLSTPDKRVENFSQLLDRIST